jgi:hypothetical protein
MSLDGAANGTSRSFERKWFLGVPVIIGLIFVTTVDFFEGETAMVLPQDVVFKNESITVKSDLLPTNSTPESKPRKGSQVAKTHHTHHTTNLSDGVLETPGEGVHAVAKTNERTNERTNDHQQAQHREWCYSQKEPANISTSTILTVPFELQRDIELCSKKNSVLGRADGLAIKAPIERPYSISAYTFSTYHARQYANLSELLHAISFGVRRWIDPLHEGSEQSQSYFVPDQWDISPLSSMRACEIMGKYSRIFTFGDSLTRHLRQGVLMILRNDFVSGGILSSEQYTKGNPYNLCKCDGQFSEFKGCRRNNGPFHSFQPRQLGVCSHLSEAEQFHFDDVVKWNNTNCKDPDFKPIALILQGGVHTKSNAGEYFHQKINPILKNPGFILCQSLGKVRVIWTTYTSQSRILDTKYPTQSRENAIIFNAEMEALLAKQPELNVSIVDWHSLTAESQTSDGFHSLSDVNVVKGYHLLHVLDQLS